MNKELVCIHGDRFRDGMRTLKNDFLGQEAQFPYGPFAIAAKFDVPKTFVYGFKTGTYDYSFYATEPIEGKLKPELLLANYVDEMEKNGSKIPESMVQFLRLLEGLMKKLINSTKFRVRFSEVDSLRIVWHGNYLKYFEDGRDAWEPNWNGFH